MKTLLSGPAGTCSDRRIDAQKENFNRPRTNLLTKTFTVFDNLINSYLSFFMDVCSDLCKQSYILILGHALLTRIHFDHRGLQSVKPVQATIHTPPVTTSVQLWSCPVT